MSMRVIVFLLAAMLAACSTGRPRDRINPPTLSIQEWRSDADGCLLRLRVHNHSSVPMTFSEVVFSQLTLDGRELAPLALAPDLEVPPNIGEPWDHALPCPALTPGASELVYRIEARVRTIEPRSERFDVRYHSRLLPVPGLDGVYR